MQTGRKFFQSSDLRKTSQNSQHFIKFSTFYLKTNKKKHKYRIDTIKTLDFVGDLSWSPKVFKKVFRSELFKKGLTYIL